MTTEITESKDLVTSALALARKAKAARRSFDREQVERLTYALAHLTQALALELDHSTSSEDGTSVSLPTKQWDEMVWCMRQASENLARAYADLSSELGE